MARTKRKPIKFDDRKARDAVCPEGVSRVEWRDAEEPGLRLIVTPAKVGGFTRRWAFRGRLSPEHDAIGPVTLGYFLARSPGSDKHMNTDAARAKVQAMRDGTAGKPAATVRPPKQRGVTVGDAIEYALQHHFVEFSANGDRKLSHGYVTQVHGTARHVLARWGERLISDIDRSEVQAWYDEEKARKPVSAEHQLNVLRKSIQVRIDAGQIENKHNPATRIKVEQRGPLELHPTPEDCRTIWRQLEKLEEVPGLHVDPWAADVLRLIYLTWARGSEWRTLLREDVEIDRGVIRWEKSGHKNDKRKGVRLHRRLGPHSLAILKRAWEREAETRDGTPPRYVFPVRRPGTIDQHKRDDKPYSASLIRQIYDAGVRAPLGWLPESRTEDGRRVETKPGRWPLRDLRKIGAQVAADLSRDEGAQALWMGHRLPRGPIAAHYVKPGAVAHKRLRKLHRLVEPVLMGDTTAWDRARDDDDDGDD